MRRAEESRLVMVGVAVAVFVGVLFALGLSRLLIMRGTGNGQQAIAAATVATSAHNSTEQGVVGGPAAIATSTAMNRSDASPQDLSQATAEPSTPQPATLAVPTIRPTVIAPATAGPPAVAYWPDYLPSGMSFAATESWPFRTITPDREQEPFLIFRGENRWLLLRYRADHDLPIPRSAAKETLQIHNTTGTLVRYSGGGFKLLLPREQRTIQLSGDGLSAEDITRVARSLRPLGDDALRARLQREAADEQLRTTFLWPGFLPEGMKLVPAETQVEGADVSAAQEDGYTVSFRGTDSFVQLGGGAVAPPQFSGTEERITYGPLTGTLTVADRRFVLVVDASKAGQAPLFPGTPSSDAKRLPLVQHGRVFIHGVNIDHEQFERVVSGLLAVRPQDFVRLARGIEPLQMSYFWPSSLPDGYAVDEKTVKAGWDDFLLQGGLPFFEITAASPQGSVMIKGGRESRGEHFLVPEGGKVERRTVPVHGKNASGARTPEGAMLVWTLNGSHYSLSSRTLTLDQLASIAEGLQPIDAVEFFRRH